MKNYDEKLLEMSEDELDVFAKKQAAIVEYNPRGKKRCRCCGSIIHVFATICTVCNCTQ